MGYQNRQVGHEIREVIIPTFVKVDGTVKKLGDYTPISAAYGEANKWRFSTSNFYIIFFDGEGAQRLVKNDTEIKRLWPAAAFDPAVSNSAVKISWLWDVKGDPNKCGWFLGDDSKTYKYRLNDYQLKEGDGFMMYAGSGHGEGVTLVSSGTVDQEDTEITAAREVRIFTGNPIPCDTTLGALTPVSAAYGEANKWRFSTSNFYIVFFDGEGAQRLVKNDSEIARLWPAAINDDAVKNSAVKISWLWDVKGDPNKCGWFLGDDSKTYKYRLDNYKLKAGDGFMMYAGNAHGDGVTLSFKSPLQTTAAE